MKILKTIIQSLLGIEWIRRGLSAFSCVNATIFSSTYLLSIPYHWLAFLPFMREQRAVLDGKKRYHRNANAPQSNRVALRRNIHRLEKGLLMDPRRDVFAQEYILETTHAYRQAVEQRQQGECPVDEDELIWANNVLTEFFEVTQAVGNIASASHVFRQAGERFTPQETGRKPYIRPQDVNLPAYDDLLNLSMYRRSVRWFQPKIVEREFIEKALLVARQAPTACNRLPYTFRIFDEPALVKKVASIPFGTAGYAENIPVIAVLVGKLESYFSARDRHAIYVDASLAAMSFAFALEVQGLSTCMINWPEFEPLEQKMQRALSLNFSDRVVMLIAIGYADPARKVPYSQKKSLESIREYNFEGWSCD
ncbi:MAG: nitroreductase family protein [Pirellulaceae bacterium]